MTPVPQKVRAFIDEITKEPPLRFDRMIARAGLDPKRHLRFRDWSGTDFSACNLRDFDFSACDLSGCSFLDSCIAGAHFDLAILAHNGALPADLSAASDYNEFVRTWRPSGDVPDDLAHLPIGALYFVAPGGILKRVREHIFTSPDDIFTRWTDSTGGGNQ
jgi:hypothetical protein